MIFLVYYEKLVNISILITLFKYDLELYNTQIIYSLV